MRTLSILISTLLTIVCTHAQETDTLYDYRDGPEFVKLYRTVKIGGQWWMAENLRAAQFYPYGGGIGPLNGDPSARYYFWYNDDSVSYAGDYGALYTWALASDQESSDFNPSGIQGICPEGWHLPSDAEWKELEVFLGMDHSEVDQSGLRGSGTANALKDTGTVYWFPPNSEATNSSGFSARGGSIRHGADISFFEGMDSLAGFWTATAYTESSEESLAWCRQLSNNDSKITRNAVLKSTAMSVRCVKDEENYDYIYLIDSSLHIVEELLFYGDDYAQFFYVGNCSGDTLTLTLVHTGTDAFSSDLTSAVLPPNDSIPVTLTFNPPSNEIYLDTLYINTVGNYTPVTTIPLVGTFPLDVSFTDSTVISCHGMSDGSVTVTPLFGVPPYTYHWDDDQSTSLPTASGLSPNRVYSVTVTDSEGDTAIDSIELSEPGLLEPLIADYLDPSCWGYADGAATVSVSGGTPPYTFQWYDESSTSDSVVTGLSADTWYHVTLTDAHLCTALDSILLSEPDPLGIVIDNSMDVSCFGFADGWARISASGGTKPYSYQWDDDSCTTDTLVRNLSPGICYHITVTDKNLCSLSDSIILTQPDPLSVNITESTNVSCYGLADGTATATITGGTAPYVINWWDDDSYPGVKSEGSGDGQVTFERFFGTTGDEEGWGIIRSSGGNYLITGRGAYSNGDVILAMADSAGVVYQVNYYGDEDEEYGTDLMETAGNDLVILGNKKKNGTDWQLYLIRTDPDGLSRWETDTFGLNKVDLGFSLVPRTNATGFLLYGYTGTYESISGMESIIYECEEDGTTGTRQPVGEEGDDYGSCIETAHDGDYLLLATVGKSGGGHKLMLYKLDQDLEEVLWETEIIPDCIPQQRACIRRIGDEAAPAGQFSYVVAGATVNGNLRLSGISEDGSVVDFVTCYDVPVTESVSVIPTSDGGFATLSDNMKLVKTAGDFTREWDNEFPGRASGVHSLIQAEDGGFVLVGTKYTGAEYQDQIYLVKTDRYGNLESGIPPEETATGLEAGGYYYITVSDQNNCPAVTDSVILSEPPMLNVSITDSTPVSCYGYADGSVTATPSGGTPPYTYSWDDPAETTDSTVTGLTSNTPYTITVYDSNGCSVAAWIDVSEPAQITCTAELSDTICPGRGDGFINTVPSGGVSPYSYNWSSGQTSQDVTGLDTGTYVLTITDNTGCAVVDSFVISAGTPFQDEQICMVGADPLTGMMLIAWEKTTGAGTDSFNIYRENTLIGSVDFDDPAIFIDTVADAEKRQYLYYLSVVDTCGNESAKSFFHKPLFLQITGSTATGVSLEWEDYEDGAGNIPFSGYILLRGTDSLDLQAIEDDIPVQVHNYTDQNPDNLTRKYYYRIAGLLSSACTVQTDTGYLPLEYSLSNYVDNGFNTGISPELAGGLTIYPNPFTGKTVLEFPNPGRDPYRMILSNLQGKVLKEIEDIREERIILDCTDLSSGIYLIELRGSKLFRSKIVIGR